MLIINLEKKLVWGTCKAKDIKTKGLIQASLENENL